MFIGHVGGRIDYAVGRLLDVVFAFPTILLALILSTLFAPSLQTAIIALIIVYIPIVAQFVRGVTRAEHGRDYVLGARVAGASPLRLLVSHVLPNIASPLLVLASSVMAFSVLAEAGLWSTWIRGAAADLKLGQDAGRRTVPTTQRIPTSPCFRGWRSRSSCSG